jgi:hypothetical protein
MPPSPGLNSLTSIGLCLCATVPVLLARTVAFTRPYTTKFLSLSYYDEKTGDYGLGFDDVYLVLFLVAVFTGLRAATMQYALVPLAKRCNLKGSKVTRFSEQSWMIIYYIISWNIGMVCDNPSTRNYSPVSLNQTTDFQSTSMPHLLTGSTSERCGRVGPTERQQFS